VLRLESRKFFDIRTDYDIIGLLLIGACLWFCGFVHTSCGYFVSEKVKEKAMRNCKRNIRYLSYILPVFVLMMGLFVAPASAQLEEPEPKLVLEPDFAEPFDDPCTPGWELTNGATVEGGFLHLESDGAMASHSDNWFEYTAMIRMRLESPAGAIGVSFTTAGDDSVRLTLGNDIIEAQRNLSGLGIDMIIERPIDVPPEVPVGEWFTLQITQLGGATIIGADGVRLYELYDPSPEPLPPNGLALSSVGDTDVEIDEVLVFPWVLENFDGPLSPAWDLQGGDATPYVQDGTLIVPPGGSASRGGNWEEITLQVRLRRDLLGSAMLYYPGHALRLQPDSIALLKTEAEQLQELASAPLPELTTEPETAAWMDVMVVIRNGEHHVLTYGIELFSITDEIAVGPVGIETLEGEFVLDRLMIGLPLPLWPAGSGEPDGGEPGGEEPGDGEPGGVSSTVLSADLAVTDLYPEHAPTGRLFFRITNNGPDALQAAPVTVTCGGTATDVTTGIVTTIPGASQGTFSITLSPGQTQAFPTTIDLDLNNFDYDLNCTVSSAPGSGVFTDPNPGNDTYTEQIASVTPTAPTADLAVTDLFPEHSPMGKLHLHIINNGPDTLNAVPVTIYCGGVATDITSGAKTSVPAASQGTFDITIAPGQTHEFPTQIDLDLDQFAYDLSCEVVASYDVLTDPAPGNNVYSEHIELLPQVQISRADLAVTDIFPDSLPQGEVYCRITNNGPDALQNAAVQLVTLVLYHPFDMWATSPINSISVTLQPGETGVFDTGVTVDTTTHWYEITCQITLPVIDPDSSNDSYSEQIGTPQAQIIHADLAVTDIFPDSLPDGSVFCRITNNGPDALQNATVDLVTSRTFNPDPQNFGTSYIAKSLTVTLQPGETGIFDTDWDVTTSLWPIEFVCDISLPLLDPDTSNNSYSEIINTSP
jgi:hypothetical protein